MVSVWSNFINLRSKMIKRTIVSLTARWFWNHTCRTLFESKVSCARLLRSFASVKKQIKIKNTHTKRLKSDKSYLDFDFYWNTSSSSSIVNAWMMCAYVSYADDCRSNSNLNYLNYLNFEDAHSNCWLHSLDSD